MLNMHEDNFSFDPGGWTCSCGAWVPMYQEHSCPGVFPLPIYAYTVPPTLSVEDRLFQIELQLKELLEIVRRLK